MHLPSSFFGRVSKLPGQQARPQTVQLSSFDSGTPDFGFELFSVRSDVKKYIIYEPPAPSSTYGIEGGFARL